jgi:hypothetical protein
VGSSFNLGSLSLDLSEIVRVTKEFIGAGLTKEAKEDLNQFSEDIINHYNKFEELFGPFYSMTAGDSSIDKFEDTYGNLKVKKNQLFLESDRLCSKVSVHLKNLKKKQSWIKKFPLVKKPLKNLQNLADDWLANDAEMYTRIRKVLEQFDKGLEEVKKTRLKDKEKTKQILTDFLSGADEERAKIQRLLVELSGLQSNFKN